MDETGRPGERWWLRRTGRRRWQVHRGNSVGAAAGVPVAEVGMLHTGEWWVCPAGESMPWAGTYPSRAAAVVAVRAWWRR